MATVDEFAIPTTILRHFDLADTPWTDLTSPVIEDRRRRSPGGRLFFDRLLELTGLDGPALYPPNTPAALRRLLHSIHSCPFDRLKRDCLLYYLLKDYDAAPSSNQAPTMDVDIDVEGEDDPDGTVVITKSAAGSERRPGKADAFAKRRCLPKTWRVFMDGYWALDHSSWEFAVSSLSDPSITTLNFVPFILNALATHVSPPSHSLSLINSFLISARPALDSVEENDVRLLALASAGSIAQAFGLIRTVDSPDERKRLRENVWCWILGAPKTACGAGDHNVQSKSLRELLHLPLAAEEDKHLIEFLSHPPRTISPPALSLLHDLVTLRLIHQGQYQDSLQLDKQLAGSGGKEEDRQRRREMVREFIAILPEAQRRALLVDVEVQSKKVDQANNAVTGSASEDIDMSSSWVNVTAPPKATAEASAPNTAIDTDINTSYAEIAAEPPAQPTPAVVAAPTPVRPPAHSALINAASVPLPSSPAALASASGPASTPLADLRPASPFSGPPRFAPGLSNANPSPRRVLSGSPFNPPPASSSSPSLANRTKGSPAPAPVPKLPRHVINDDGDDEDNESVLGRRSKAKGSSRLSRAPSKSVEPDSRSEQESDIVDEIMVIDENHPISSIAEEPSTSNSDQAQAQEAPKSVRKSSKVASKPREKTHSPPPLPHSPPATARKPRTRRQSSAAPPATPGLGPTNGMPGAYGQGNHSEDEMPPPAPAAPSRGLPRSRTSAALPDSAKPRSRMTRSVSRAIMDEDEEDRSHGAGKSHETPGAPPSKKTKSTTGSSNSFVRRSSRASLAPSMTSEADEYGAGAGAGAGGGMSVRRSTRSRTAGPSEQGSPTPSDAGSVVGGTRRRTRSAREGSATPRMSTRTRRG
ncbi:hypothetical protein I317_00690 [Kwoniella heveanensis CBS 569]|nr:hypothetical protein I317_00690 [Kwoniella heveanensis CBS 569]